MRFATALCLVGLVASTQAGTHQIEGRIVGVHDGDTITLLDVDNRQHKIRLDGIDAPELGQPFRRASKQHLAELLFNRQVVAECSKTDRYRREVCRELLAGLEQRRGAGAPGVRPRLIRRLHESSNPWACQRGAGHSGTPGRPHGATTAGRGGGFNVWSDLESKPHLIALGQ